MRIIPGGEAEEQIRMGCIGDSLTSLYPNTPYDHYPRYLAEQLARPGRMKTIGSVDMGTYRTEGHSGFTTAMFLAAWSTYAPYFRDATHVPVLLGVNDQLVDGLTATQTIANLIAIRAAVLAVAPRARVPICTFLPVGPGIYYASRVDWIAEVNPRIRTEIEDVFDLNARGLNPVTMTGDGLHTNELGARTVAPWVTEGFGLTRAAA